MGDGRPDRRDAEAVVEGLDGGVDAVTSTRTRAEEEREHFDVGMERDRHPTSVR